MRPYTPAPRGIALPPPPAPEACGQGRCQGRSPAAPAQRDPQHCYSLQPVHTAAAPRETNGRRSEVRLAPSPKSLRTLQSAPRDAYHMQRALQRYAPRQAAPPRPRCLPAAASASCRLPSSRNRSTFPARSCPPAPDHEIVPYHTPAASTVPAQNDNPAHPHIQTTRPYTSPSCG